MGAAKSRQEVMADSGSGFHCLPYALESSRLFPVRAGGGGRRFLPKERERSCDPLKIAQKSRNKMGGMVVYQMRLSLQKHRKTERPGHSNAPALYLTHLECLLEAFHFGDNRRRFFNRRTVQAPIGQRGHSNFSTKEIAERAKTRISDLKADLSDRDIRRGQQRCCILQTELRHILMRCLAIDLLEQPQKIMWRKACNF